MARWHYLCNKKWPTVWKRHEFQIRLLLAFEGMNRKRILDSFVFFRRGNFIWTLKKIKLGKLKILFVRLNIFYDSLIKLFVPKLLVLNKYNLNIFIIVIYKNPYGLEQCIF